MMNSYRDTRKGLLMMNNYKDTRKSLLMMNDYKDTERNLLMISSYKDTRRNSQSLSCKFNDGGNPTRDSYKSCKVNSFMTRGLAADERRWLSYD